MVLDNLFKHKVNFCLVGYDMDDYEPYIYSKGYHYVSREIENGESVGARDVTDLCQRKLKPLFSHIISTMMREHMREELYHITIKVHLTCGEDYEDYEIVRYEFVPGPDFSIESYEVCFYTYPENLLTEKFSIYVESYAYIFPDITRENDIDTILEMDDDVMVPYTPPEKTHKQEQCVICLESAPNILYLNCMHIAVCEFCDDMKRTAALRLKCDVCRTIISRRIRV